MAQKFLGIGAGLGILFAPKSGKETRAELKEKLDDKYIQLDGSGTEKPVNGHIAALQDDTSHALSFSVTYQGEVIREGMLTINKIGALGDNYPQTRATDWSAAPRWYIPVALTRNP